MIEQNKNTRVFNEATAVGTSDPYYLWGAKQTFHATGQTTAGAGAVVVKIFGSNMDAPNKAVAGDWVELGEISLVLSTTKTGDSFAIDAPYRFFRAEVMSISGTNAAVSLLAGR